MFPQPQAIRAALLSMFLSDPRSTALLLFLTALLFYFLVPVGGAFYVRGRWREFRYNLRFSLDLPMLKPRYLPGDRESGLFRFKGRLEAIEGDDIVWIKGPGGSVCADMRDAVVYNMTDPGSDDQVYSFLYPFPLPRISLSPMRWSEVFSLTEGTKVYLFGDLAVERGRYVLGSSRQMALTVIIYNEDPFTLIPRAIWSGRQSNEYWNALTPWSLLIGVLLLLIATAWLFQNSADYRLPFIGLLLALMPMVLFLPPGFFLFHLYKRFWDRGRKARAERDLMQLPMGLEALGKEPLPEGEVEKERILYDRRPESWTPDPGDEACCYPLPRGLLEMAERELKGDCVRFPADPEKLTRYCRHKALFYEFLSWMMLLSGLFLNYGLIWLVLRGLN